MEALNFGICTGDIQEYVQMYSMTFVSGCFCSSRGEEKTFM